MKTIQSENINKNKNYENIISIESSKEDKTFNTLKRIQSLLKKESALKQLCK